MSPLEINVLLHVYTTPEPLTEKHNGFDNQALQEFVWGGMVDEISNEQGESRFKLTDLGKAYVKQILDIKIPTLAYLDNNGNPIDLGDI